MRTNTDYKTPLVKEFQGFSLLSAIFGYWLISWCLTAPGKLFNLAIPEVKSWLCLRLVTRELLAKRVSVYPGTGLSPLH